MPPQIKEKEKEKEKEPLKPDEFWKIWNSKCKKSCCFEGLGSLF